MASALQPRNRLSSLPNEIKLEIFLQLPDAASVHNFSMVSKDFRSILDQHHATIVRTLVNHLVSPECAKLAVMARESRRVDTTDNSDIQHFFDRFMNRDELGDDQLDLETANEIPLLHHAIIALQNQGLHSWVFRPNQPSDTRIDPATDPMRLIQSYYILEIFSNICLSVNGPSVDDRYFSFGLIASVNQMMLSCGTDGFLDGYTDVTNMPEGTTCPACDKPGTEENRLLITPSTCSFEAVYHLANFYGHHGKHGHHHSWSKVIIYWLDDLIEWTYENILDPNLRHGGPYIRPGISAASPFLAGIGK